ncbi:MAG: hypothetical protein LBB56_00040 [Chitinispirillales bacterium]|jgi:Tfp pilus assembly protein PilF|nr:hypothetical protein [Chitinispirillales bacterium]
MKKISMKRGAAVFLCILSLSALTFAQGNDDLFGDGGGAVGESSGAKIADIDQSSIDNLFGTFETPAEKPEAGVPARVLPPFEGTYKVLISRPIYAVYEAETKTKWISALGEVYSYYKIGAFPRTHVFTPEQINGILPNYRDYNRRISRQTYIEAAKKLGATHVIYQEYQPQKDGKTTLYSMELFWIEQNATVLRATQNILHNAFEGGLDICLAKIADAMDSGAKSTSAFKVNLLGKDQKNIEAFGNALANEGSFSKDRAAATYNAADRMIQRSSETGFQYAAALLSGRAEGYAKAIEHINAVISRSGDYPGLQLRLAEYLRGAERYGEAMSAVQNASKNPALSLAVSAERAAIYQAQGNLEQARSEYNSILQSGQADGQVFFRLATLSIQMNRIDESTDYLARAAQAGLSLDENEYFELGAAYAEVSGYEDQAMEYLKKSMGVKQANEEAWRIIAMIHKRNGNEQLEAETYVNLFKLNMNAHKGGIKIAGEIYERIGMVDKAKDAYALFLDRRFVDADVSMSLARIYFNDKECKRLPDVLKGLDTIPEAVQMLSDCGFARRVIDPSQALKGDKMSPVRLTIRVSTVALFIGGIAGGYAFNSQVEKLGDDYSNTKSRDEADKLRNDIEKNEMLRNVLYTVGAVAAVGFGVTFFF